MNDTYHRLASLTRAARAQLQNASWGPSARRPATERDSKAAATAARSLMELCVELGRVGGPATRALSAPVRGAAVWSAMVAGELGQMSKLGLSFNESWAVVFRPGLIQLQLVEDAFEAFSETHADVPVQTVNRDAVSTALAGIVEALRGLDGVFDGDRKVRALDVERATDLAGRLVRFLEDAAALEDPVLEGILDPDFVEVALAVGRLAGEMTWMYRNERLTAYPLEMSGYLDAAYAKLELVSRLLLPPHGP